MGKKIEMTEDEFKKIVLILKCSKRYVNLPPSNLFLGNLWRVSSKLADKLLKRNGFQIVKGTGSRYTVKPVEDCLVVKDYKWLVNLQSRTWRNFKHQNPMMKRTWKIHLSANYVTQSKSNLEASLENPVGLYFSDCFPPKFFLYSSIKNFSL